MKYTIPGQGEHPPFTMEICGAVYQDDARLLRCFSDVGHTGDHFSAYGLFWGDGGKPYRLGPGECRGTNGAPERMVP